MYVSLFTINKYYKYEKLQLNIKRINVTYYKKQYKKWEVNRL